MTISSKILTEDLMIKEMLCLDNEKDYPYLVNRVSYICLTKLVELIFRNKFGDPLRLLPFQSVMLHTMWHKKFPMMLACRGAGKTFMIAIYCLLKCLLEPGTQIVIVSGGFRQAKFAFLYMDELIKNSPILQESIRKYHPGNDFGVKFATDKVYVKIGSNTGCTGIPIGDGCLSPSAQITDNNGFITIGEMCKNIQTDNHIDNHDKEIWGNGQFNKSDFKFDNGIKPTLKIITKKGYEIEGTLNHKIKILRNQKIEWIRFDELKVGDNPLIDRSYRWHSAPEKDITNDQAYALGALIGDGSWTQPTRIRFTTLDLEIIKRIQRVFTKKFIQRNDKIHWDLQSRAYKEDWCDFWNLSYQCYTIDKSLPNKILSASRENMTACLQGLFDTDGTCQVNKDPRGGTSVTVSFTNTSEKLVKQIQYILTHYGIIARLSSRQRENLSWNRIYELFINGDNVSKFAKEIGFYVQRKQQKLLNGLRQQVRSRSVGDIIPNIIDDTRQLAKDYQKNELVKRHNIRLEKLKDITRSTATILLDAYQDISDPFLNILSELNDQDIYYDEIVEIQHGQSPTYDIHVPNYHEYCANAFYSHNTKVRGMRACVEPTTIVETKQGLRRIKDLVDNPEDVELHYGNYLYEKPIKFVKTLPIDAYRITTECGYEIICSDIHRLYTTEGWKDAIKLVPGKDAVELHPEGQFNTIEKLGQDFAWLLGAIISEGCCSNKYRISVKNSVPQFCNEVERIAKAQFGKASRYYIAPRHDARGWISKEGHEIHFGNLKQRQWLYDTIGLDYSTARDKKVPTAILNGTKEEIISFLTGAFDGDGTCYLYKDKTRDNNLGISYYTASEQLSKDIQTLLLKLGIITTRSSQTSKLSVHPQYMLRVSGQQMLKFIQLIRPQRFIDIYKKADLNVRFHQEKWVKKIKSIEKLPDKHVLYDFEIPNSHAFIGNGLKNHNTTLICDEVASIDDKVFDTAIGPFLSVQADPAEAVIVEEFIATLRRLNAKQSIIRMVENASRHRGNQLILTGTATYQFNHFYRRYQAYNIFAKSGGNKKKIKEGLQLQSGESKAPVTDDMLELWTELYKQYAIFQLPYYAMPPGFLDAAVVATHRATMDPVIFGHEYETHFSKDTNGFFPRSMVEDASPGKKEAEAGATEVHYELYGDPNAQYVMGLDPARWNDNFGLVVLKLIPTGAEVVYVESWNKAKFKESVKRIRAVLRRFPNMIYIALDKGGGGDTIQELLANAKMLKEGERPIIEIDPESEYKAIPNAQRILEMVNFHTWAAPANHALKSDIILKNIMFPGRLDDEIILHNHAKILKADSSPFDLDDPEDVAIVEHLYDLLYGTEDDDDNILTLGVYREMSMLVDELCTIVLTVTEKGTETFGLPKLSEQPEGLDIRRRDRYSALLLAAHAARTVKGHGHQRISQAMGGSPSMILGDTSGRRSQYRPMRKKGGVAF